MKNKRKSLLVLIVLTLFSGLVNGQINTPKLSPHCLLTQEIGFNEITIDYCRPSVKGRKIFGGLVPFDTIWRTGANASTKIKFKEEVFIEGNEIPAGEYALYTIPGKNEWTIILHTVTSYWGVGKDYDPKDDLLRFKVKPIVMNHTIETMAIEFSDITSFDCFLEIKWDNILVKFKITTDTDKRIMSEIDEKMKGVTQATYFQSAVYYLENDKDMNKALEWINKALINNETFWILRQKSLILAKLGRYKEAIAVAENSKKLAAESENDDFVALNEKSIAVWKSLIK
ncbi:MAG: DUF2911 domain-containing protein [Flavobacteriales bacterium]|nr:DUF2911 domain-containing protein [Flavobacteriales bacterium]